MPYSVDRWPRLLFILVAFVSPAGAAHSPGTSGKGGSTAEMSGEVTSTTDGDTITVSGVGPVRLIGVDTPEEFHPTKPVQFMARQASEFTRKAVLGKRVTLEFEDERRDKYDRTLAYVTLPDGRMLNAELIRTGYAFAYLKFPFKRKNQFVALEAEAKKAGRGVWRDGGLAEVRWLKEQGRPDFSVFEMENAQWGIRFGDFVLARVPPERLAPELESLRLAVNERSPGDLAKELDRRGFRQSSGKTIDVGPPNVLGKTIPWEDAGDFIGREAVVEGLVVKTHNSGKACFLNFHNNWKRYFNGVIFAADFPKFPDRPEGFYLNRRVQIRGLIEDHEGHPEIVVNDPRQIKIVKD